jgi:aminomuconate-semialdehyde/2-hydroxymuconate-6-semialdehyde dehydrogenase
LVKKTAAERSNRHRKNRLCSRAHSTFRAAASNFWFFATAILYTESEAHITDNVAFNDTLRQPRGIAGLNSPWNVPLYNTFTKPGVSRIS